tara:strand:+ start:1546 stop:1893 length:348 start_codon:yes stop_codon:yes gene_type:complete
MAGARRGLHNLTVQEAQNASLGQAGAIFHAGTDTITAPTGSAFTAIQFIEDAVFNGTDGLTAVDDKYWPNTQSGATSIDSNGTVVDSVTFSAGTTIYGRWSSFILSSGKVIAYLG